MSRHGLKSALHPVPTLWERAILRWALRELHPTHPVVPDIVCRLHASEHTESPMDPADSIVTGASVIAALFFFGLVAMGVVK